MYDEKERGLNTFVMRNCEVINNFYQDVAVTCTHVHTIPPLPLPHPIPCVGWGGVGGCIMCVPVHIFRHNMTQIRCDLYGDIKAVNPFS